MTSARRTVVGWAVALAAACGGGDDGGRPDGGGAPDAGPDAPSGIPIEELRDPEGGGVHLDYINLAPDLADEFGTPSLARGVATLFDAMTPDAMPAPGFEQCTALVGPRGGPGLAWPIAVGEDVAYLDGGLLELVSVDAEEAEQIWELPAAELDPPPDALGRPHGAYWEAILFDATTVLAPDTRVTLEIGGSKTYDATTITEALILPPAFEVLDPGLDDDVTFTAGEDATVTWGPTAEPTGGLGDAYALEIVALLDRGSSGIVVYCPFTTDAGEATIPGAAIQAYRDAVEAAGHDPDTALLWRASAVLDFVTLPLANEANVRRLDFLASYAYAQVVTIDPAR